MPARHGEVGQRRQHDNLNGREIGPRVGVGLIYVNISSSFSEERRVNGQYAPRKMLRVTGPQGCANGPPRGTPGAPWGGLLSKRWGRAERRRGWRLRRPYPLGVCAHGEGRRGPHDPGARACKQHGSRRPGAHRGGSGQRVAAGPRRATASRGGSGGAPACAAARAGPGNVTPGERTRPRKTASSRRHSQRVPRAGSASEPKGVGGCQGRGQGGRGLGVREQGPGARAWLPFWTDDHDLN